MKFPKPMIIVLIGAAITLLGGIIVAIGNYKQTKASSLKTDAMKATGEDTNLKSVEQLEKINRLQADNLKLSTQVDSLQTKYVKQLEKIQILTNQNADLAIQLTNSTLNIAGNITGGDSFCLLSFSVGSDNYPTITVGNNGKYGISGISATITDLEDLSEVVKTLPKPSDLNEIPEISAEQTKRLHRNDRIVNIGNIPPGTGRILGKLDIPFYGNKRTFNIFTSGKNGLFVQMLRMYNLNGKWIHATRVKRTNSENVIYEQIDNKFPMEKFKWE